MIDEENLKGLEAFATVAALSIENARLQVRLAEEQRLATWKEFTARIAHIIGARIAVIAGVVTQLRFYFEEEKDGESAKIQPYLVALGNSIRKAQMALVEFRQFAVPLELRFEELDLVQVVKTICKEIQHSIDCPIKITLPDKPLLIRGDSLRLSDAFTELIRNAHEAMQQNTERLPQIMITLNVERSPVRSGFVARIGFTDTGLGIPKVDKRRVFEPFFSTRGRSSGLGLAIVKNIIEQHQGTIEEVGLPGTGAQFIIRLPIMA
jgi:two-component system nitrogen regulation sensor histidine kinase NtrY